MKILFYIFLLSFSFSSFSQSEHKHVKLTEKTKGKRLELFAVNTDTISYDIFLRVVTEDYRRSSKRPILKTIPPNSEIKLLTMVKLAGKQGTYNSTFIVNEVAYDIAIFKDKKDFDIKFDKALKEKRITIFTKNNCLFCNDIKGLLNANTIKFQEYNISSDSLNIIRLAKELKTKKVDSKTYVPILKIEDSLYTKIKNRKELIDALKNHF